MHSKEKRSQLWTKSPRSLRTDFLSKKDGKCLPEGRSGITKQRLTMRSYQITNQSRTVLIKLVFGYLPKKWFSHFGPELSALPQPKVLPLYYSAHGIKQLLFTWLKLFLIDSIKIKTGLGYTQWKSTTCLHAKGPGFDYQQKKTKVEQRKC